MKKPTKAQKIEFWEWCGLTEFEKPIVGDESISAKPCIPYIDLPPIDLNNLFKYAVPKLVERIGKARAAFRLQHWIHLVTMDGKDPALALFWAIYSVFIEEKK